MDFQDGSHEWLKSEFPKECVTTPAGTTWHENQCRSSAMAILGSQKKSTATNEYEGVEVVTRYLFFQGYFIFSLDIYSFISWIFTLDGNIPFGGCFCKRIRSAMKEWYKIYWAECLSQITELKTLFCIMLFFDGMAWISHVILIIIQNDLQSSMLAEKSQLHAASFSSEKACVFYLHHALVVLVSLIFQQQEKMLLIS